MSDDNNSAKSGWLPILAYGFRPFFFLAGVHGAVVLLLWLQRTGSLAGGDLAWP